MNLLRNFLVSIILLGISSSGISAGYSKSNTSTSSSTNATTHTGTTLASLGGNVNVNAENALTITGSQVLALAAQPKPDDNNTVGNPSVGNITLSGKTVLINEAHDTYSSTNAPKEVPLGDTSTSVGSTIQGNNVSITATGGDLTAIGANISATNNAALSATGNINLLAATNASQTESHNSSKSAGASVSMTLAGVPTGGSANVSRGNGNSTEASTTHSNTHVSAGNTLSLSSGGNTNLIGATASGSQIIANIGTGPNGGNLNIQSLQDSYTYSETQSTKGAGVSVSGKGAPGVSVSVGNTRINASTQTVTEQSGLMAGDKGFQLNVNGATNLIGGVITSTQSAQDLGLNTLNTTSVNASNLTNTANYAANAYGMTVGVGNNLGSSGAGVGKASDSQTSTTLSGITGGVPQGTGTPVNGALNTIPQGDFLQGAVTTATVNAGTGQTTNALVNPFDKAKVKADVGAQVQITKEFGQQASKTVGDYGTQKLKEAEALKAQAKAETDDTKKQALLDQAQQITDDWKEGGTLRVLAHTLVGGLTAGNIQGAFSAAVSQTAIPIIGEEIAKLDLPLELKQTLVQLAAIGIGAATGGVSGVVASQNATANNYLSHIPKFVGAKSEKQQYDDAVAACNGGSGDKAACQQRDELAALSLQRDTALSSACGAQGSKETCDFQIQQAKDSGNAVRSFAGSEGRFVYAESTVKGATATDLNPRFVTDPNNPQAGTFQEDFARAIALPVLGGVAAAGLAVGVDKLIELGYAAQTTTATFGVSTALKSAGAGATIGGGFYAVTTENPTINGAVPSMVAGGISGVIKLGWNAAMGIPNQWIANTIPNAATWVGSSSFGQIIKILMKP